MDNRAKSAIYRARENGLGLLNASLAMNRKNNILPIVLIDNRPAAVLTAGLIEPGLHIAVPVLMKVDIRNHCVVTRHLKSMETSELARAKLYYHPTFVFPGGRQVNNARGG